MPSCVLLTQLLYTPDPILDEGCDRASPSVPFTSSLCANSQVWSEELFKLAMNILAQNASRNTFLRKA